MLWSKYALARHRPHILVAAGERPARQQGQILTKSWTQRPTTTHRCRLPATRALHRRDTDPVTAPIDAPFTFPAYINEEPEDRQGIFLFLRLSIEFHTNSRSAVWMHTGMAKSSVSGYKVDRHDAHDALQLYKTCLQPGSGLATLRASQLSGKGSGVGKNYLHRAKPFIYLHSTYKSHTLEGICKVNLTLGRHM